MSLGELWPQNNLYCLWHLADNTDSSGNGLTLGVISDPEYVASSGRFRGYVDLDGNDYSTKTGTTLDVDKDFTFGIWFKPDVDLGANDKYAIFDLRYNHGNCEYCIVEYYATAAGTRRIALYPGTGTYVSATKTITVNTWHLIGVTGIGAENHMYLYLDGAPLIDSACGTSNANYDRICLGAYYGLGDYFYGQLAEAFGFQEAKPASWWRKYYALSRGLL